MQAHDGNNQDRKNHIEFEENYILLKGFVSKIASNSVFISVSRESGIVHVFEIHKDYALVPLEELKLGEEVVVRVSIRERSEFRIYLNDTEIKTLPHFCSYEKEAGKISIPTCLKEKAFCSWPARKEILDQLIRSSWLYGFNVQIEDIPSYRIYEFIKEGERVEGKVIEEVKDRKGEITGIRVLVKVREHKINGFLRLSECSWLRIKSPLEILKIGERSIFRVIKLRPLTLSRKKAFLAYTKLLSPNFEVRKKTIGYLIGKGGHRIKRIKEGLDVEVKFQNNEKIVVMASSQQDMEKVCKRIDEEIKGLDNWEFR